MKKRKLYLINTNEKTIKVIGETEPLPERPYIANPWWRFLYVFFNERWRLN